MIISLVMFASILVSRRRRAAGAQSAVSWAAGRHWLRGRKSNRCYCSAGRYNRPTGKPTLTISSHERSRPANHPAEQLTDPWPTAAAARAAAALLQTAGRGFLVGCFINLTLHSLAIQRVWSTQAKLRKDVMMLSPIKSSFSYFFLSAKMFKGNNVALQHCSNQTKPWLNMQHRHSTEDRIGRSPAALAVGFILSSLGFLCQLSLAV